ncbi:LysM peptidoglycan-binding domain-containing protein [Nocardioides alpinus]|uniref:LysM peptidoglycan-binding domain-containing protein n=1 Tax=Nocardioides alpinus TaxID=748909 RepID=UPI0018E2FA39|nr:LysM domain-containing protein [Nocardioides alpinus]
MSRGNSIRAWRPVVVWCSVTAAASATAVAVPDAWAGARRAQGPDGVADLLVAVCGTGLALALAWLWVITTLTVAGLLAGTARTAENHTGGATHRLVLLACGVAVVAGTGVPAMATGGDGRDLLVGLTLPERAVAPPQQHRPAASADHVEPAARTAPTAPDTYVVRPGDSLWSIAAAHPGQGDLDSRWRAIWQTNHGVVGDDPDLIIPGQALRLPPTHDPSSDGDR